MQGFVAPTFQGVAEAFEKNFAVRGDGAAQCCVHVDGEKVIDLWRGYDEDSIQVVFSATKGATAACANLLIQRGLLDLDAPVIDYCPSTASTAKIKHWYVGSSRTRPVSWHPSRGSRWRSAIPRPACALAPTRPTTQA